jgi:hypothetical protein
MPNFSLFSDDDDPKRDTAAAPLLDTLTITKEPSREEAVVVRSPKVPPQKSTSVRASKRLKKAGTASTSLEVHRPVASSDNVSNAFRACFFVACFFLTYFFSAVFDAKISLPWC